jgi:hypothetical protein
MAFLGDWGHATHPEIRAPELQLSFGGAVHDVLIHFLRHLAVLDGEETTDLFLWDIHVGSEEYVLPRWEENHKCHHPKRNLPRAQHIWILVAVVVPRLLKDQNETRKAGRLSAGNSSSAVF